MFLNDSLVERLYFEPNKDTTIRQEVGHFNAPQFRSDQDINFGLFAVFKHLVD